MSEYISRESAIEAASIWNGDEATEAWIKSNLKKLPAADVVERKTGKWIKETNPTLGACLQEVYICSVCGVASGCQYSVRRSFCPNCGADLRELE